MTIIASNTLRWSTQLQILPNRRAFVWQNTVHLQSSHLFFFSKNIGFLEMLLKLTELKMYFWKNRSRKKSFLKKLMHTCIPIEKELL